ncbi:MAG: menaquinone biosynthesis protein [Spirochaetia bacterium]|nr:menaquinone biosynthesis protein [Spirochaetia bacterium]
MRIGLVSALNARPLDWGFRLQAEEKGFTLVEDTPARLAAALFQGQLDTALISSVECLRHSDSFAWCTKVGVAAADAVQSILYFSRKAISQTGPSKVLVDASSRSSTALVQVLLHAEYKRRIPVEEAPPERLVDLVAADQGGMLIGDNALRFARSPAAAQFVVQDLAHWWRKIEGLPFVFALWAYPKAHPVPDEFFETSLAKGLSDVKKIAEGSEFPNAYDYLTKTLHYQLTADDLTSLRTFLDRTRALGLV